MEIENSATGITTAASRNSAAVSTNTINTQASLCVPQSQVSGVGTTTTTSIAASSVHPRVADLVIVSTVNALASSSILMLIQLI